MRNSANRVLSVPELRSRFDEVIQVFPALVAVSTVACSTWELVRLNSTLTNQAKQNLGLFLEIDLATIDDERLVDKLKQAFPSGKGTEQRVRHVFTEVLGLSVSMRTSSGLVPDQVLRLWLSSLLGFDGLALPPGTRATWGELSAFPAWREHAKRELGRRFLVDVKSCNAGVLGEAVKRGLDVASCLLYTSPSPRD